jgi:chromosome segregation ATPase|tara:strand:+ start:246 stop:563 length:318 start_codon:yes stop_codon:yes gene_type:complete
MSERDLVDELKANIKDLQDEKADMAKTIEGKERRIKQILIKLEHATKDVQSTGHKIGEQNKVIADLEAKLDTKEKLLDEALQKIKGTQDDSAEPPEEVLEQSEEE